MLLHERSTTAGAVLGVVAIVFLVGQQLAVLFGLLTLMSALIDNSGADIWVVSQNTTNTQSAGTLPSRYVDRLAGLVDVEWALPIVLGGGQLKLADGTFQPVQIVGVSRPQMHGGPWQFAAGSNDVLLEYDGVTVDKFDLENLGDPRLGEVAEVNSRRVRIVGYTQGSRVFGAPLLFTNATKAREVTGIPADRCSNILIKLGCSVARAVADIKALLPRAEPVPSAELARNTKIYNLTSTGIGSSFGVSTMVGVLVGVIIIILLIRPRGIAGMLDKAREA